MFIILFGVIENSAGMQVPIDLLMQQERFGYIPITFSNPATSKEYKLNIIQDAEVITFGDT